jgi:hypothetical protein
MKRLLPFLLLLTGCVERYRLVNFECYGMPHIDSTRGYTQVSCNGVRQLTFFTVTDYHFSRFEPNGMNIITFKVTP